MKNIRTGLLIEQMEAARLPDKIEEEASGIVSRVEKLGACTLTEVKVTTEQGAKALGRQCGTYVTIEMDKAYEVTDEDFECISDLLAKTIKDLTEIQPGDKVLVAGIGNRDITPDSLGPKCVDKVVVTRKLERTAPELIDSRQFSSVSALCTNVYGVTGIESSELISGVTEELMPKLVIVVDALATSSLDRLCKTIQISNTALTPGGGVDNARSEISYEKLKTKILSVGMPTIIDAKTVVLKALEQAKLSEEEAQAVSLQVLEPYEKSLISMPARIDSATDRGAKLISFAINKALHSQMSTSEILKFLY